MAAKTDSDSAVKKQRPKPTHPTYLEMAKEAIVSIGDKKGASVPALQSYIAGKYSIDIETVRVHLKPALAKGLENGALVRPKNSEAAKGYQGRFKVDKTKTSEEEKAKKLKEKEKLKKEKAKEKKPEKATVKKKTATGKSPAKKKATVKTKTKIAAKKSPKKKTEKKAVEKKPKAAKSLLKTPIKKPKTLKTAKKAKTPASSKK